MLKTYIAAKMQIDKMKDRLARDEGGASLIEYSILIGLITVVAVATIKTVGAWVGTQWTNLNANLG